MVDRIQQALAEDLIPFDDLDNRFAAVYGASSRAELERVAAELPTPQFHPPPPTARHPAPSSQFSVIGDIRIGGWVSMGDRLTLTDLIGDIMVDLSSASFGPEGITVDVRSLIGDAKIIVPDGARVQIETTLIVGDKRQALAPPVEGGPLIRITGFQLIGDLRVFSLSLVPDGPLRRLWSKLRRDS